MQREEHAIRHPLDMVVHVQPWMLIPIVPLIFMFEGTSFLKYFISIDKFICISEDPFSMLFCR